MSDTFLSRDEVAELTGAKTRRKQLAVLRVNGVRHYVNAAGWPVVPRCVLAGAAPSGQDVRPRWKPRFAA